MGSLNSELRVRDIGEQQLLERLHRYCPAQIIGDDAAVLPTHPDRLLVVTTDMLVDGVHFSVGSATPKIYTTSPTDVGWRAAAANLSDLAAMGATPLGITVALGLPPATPVRWIEELYEGMTDCLNRYQTPILGGDLCRSPVLTVSITALGEVLPERQILRSLAQVGDVIVVTGVHGASRAGLELLLNPAWGKDLSPEAHNELKRSHQRPIPRLDVPPLIWRIDPSARVAGMDSSDGLADAVLQICRASGVGARLRHDRLPIPPVLEQTQFLSETELLNWALYGGEDFELVLCLPSAIAEALVAQVGGGAAIVGQIISERSVFLEDTQGQRIDPPLSLDRGFQHFG
ncbi:MAG: thiamine-phosphate kinase [Acaryochloridaceae cyanobacterium RU_4_10]|nr:thiamine-phosphate kinase [Acaryochloridaceae cyanobacterium RU_4_10]